MVPLFCWLLLLAVGAEVVRVVDVVMEEQLIGISRAPNSYYRLKNDIVLTKPWTPIKSFTGVLDGQGKTISNITFAASTTPEHTGFFAVMSEAQIYDVTFRANASITLDNPESKTPSVALGVVGGKVSNTVFYMVKVEGYLKVTANFDHQKASLIVGGALGVYDCDAIAGSGVYSNAQVTVDCGTLKLCSVGGTVGQLDGSHGLTDISAGDSCEVKVTARTVTNMTVGGIVGMVRGVTPLRYVTSTVRLVNASAQSGIVYVGGAVGMAGVLQHIDSTAGTVLCQMASVTPAKADVVNCYVGGVVGGLFTAGENTTASVRLRATSPSSGIKCSLRRGSVCHAGGVIGGIHQVTLNDCVSYAAPTAVGSGWIAVGGLVGTINGGRIIGGRVYLDALVVDERYDAAEVHVGGLVGDATRRATSPFVSIGDSFVRIKSINVTTDNSAKVGGIVGAHRTTADDVYDVGGELYSCSVIVDKISVVSTKEINTGLTDFIAVGGVAGTFAYVTARDIYAAYNTISVETHSITAGVGGIQGLGLNSRIGTAFAVGDTISYKNLAPAIEGTGEAFVGGASGYSKFSTLRHIYADTNLISASASHCKTLSMGGFAGYSNASRHYLVYSVAQQISLTRGGGSYSIGGFVGIATVGVGAYDIDKTWSYAHLEAKCQPGVTCEENQYCNIGGYAGRATGLMDIRYSYAEGTLSCMDNTCSVGLFVGRQTASQILQSMSIMSFSGTAKSGTSITWAGYLTASSTRPTPCTGCLYASDFGGVMSLSDLDTNPIFDKAFTAQNMIRNFTLKELVDSNTYTSDSLGSGYYIFGPSKNWYKDENKLPILPSMPYRAVRIIDVQSKSTDIAMFDGCKTEFCWSANAAGPVKGSWTIDTLFGSRPVFKITTMQCKPWSLCATDSGAPNKMICSSLAKGTFCNECLSDRFCSHGGKCRSGVCSCRVGLGGSDCTTQYCRMTSEGLCGGVSNSCSKLFDSQHTCMCANGFTKLEGICIRSPAALSAEPKDSVVVNRGEGGSAPVNIILTAIFAVLTASAAVALIVFVLRIFVCKTARLASSSRPVSGNLSMSWSTHFGNQSADNISLLAS